MHTLPSERYRKWARKINHQLLKKQGADISAEAFIAPGMKINYQVGIVIRAECVTGRNVNLRQSMTIGRKDSVNLNGKSVIGDNVDIGNISIEDDVTIGAISFVNRDIPANSVVYAEKTTGNRPR